jgi:hypothetical protein
MEEKLIQIKQKYFSNGVSMIYYQDKKDSDPITGYPIEGGYDFFKIPSKMQKKPLSRIAEKVLESLVKKEMEKYKISPLSTANAFICHLGEYKEDKERDAVFQFWKIKE